MYINGRKITIEELQRMANKLIGAMLDNLYDDIQRDGLDKALPHSKIKKRAALSKMMEFYIDQEEYEKCSVVRDLLKTIK